MLEPSKKFENLDIKKLSTLGVIPLHGEGLNGYLMVASTVEENYDIDHLSEFKKLFTIACKELGKHISLHSEMIIETVPIDVADWTEEMGGDYTLIREFGKGYMVVSFMRTEYQVPELVEDKATR